MYLSKKIVLLTYVAAFLASTVHAEHVYQPVKMYGKWWMVRVEKGQNISKEVVRLLISSYNLKEFAPQVNDKIRPANAHEIPSVKKKKSKANQHTGKLVTFTEPNFTYQSKDTPKEKDHAEENSTDNAQANEDPRKIQLEKLLKQIDTKMSMICQGLSIALPTNEKNIKKGLQKLKLKWHPDKNPGRENEFKQIFQKLVDIENKLSRYLALKVQIVNALLEIVAEQEAVNKPENYATPQEPETLMLTQENEPLMLSYIPYIDEAISTTPESEEITPGEETIDTETETPSGEEEKPNHYGCFNRFFKRLTGITTFFKRHSTVVSS